MTPFLQGIKLIKETIPCFKVFLNKKGHCIVSFLTSSYLIVLAKTKALLYNELEEEVKRLQTTGTVIVFSMPITQLSDDLFKNIQQSTIKV